MNLLGVTLTTWTEVTAFATLGAAIAAAVATGAAWRTTKLGIDAQRDERQQHEKEQFEKAVRDLERRLELLGEKIVELADVAHVAGLAYTVKQQELKVRLAGLRPFSRPLPVCESLDKTPASDVGLLIETALAEIEAETRRVLFEGPPGRPAVQAARMLSTPPSPLDWKPTGDPVSPGPLPEAGRFYGSQPTVSAHTKKARPWSWKR